MMKACEGGWEVRWTWWYAQLGLRAGKAVGCRAALLVVAMAVAPALTSTERRRFERGGPRRVRRSKREGVESSGMTLRSQGCRGAGTRIDDHGNNAVRGDHAG
jgi:hypothetical protein